MLFTSKTFGQNPAFYKTLSGNLKFYTQINKDPVFISHGNLLSEDSLPNYTKGMQFMLSTGLFNSVDELYSYLTDNPLFYFKNYNKKGSYYNKATSHNKERKMHYESGIDIYNESKSIQSDDEAIKTGVWNLISNVRYQLIFEEDYIKDENYEFLIIHTVNVFKADLNPNSIEDVNKISNTYLKISNGDEKEKIEKSSNLICLIKEDGIWKACSAEAVFEYLQGKGYLQLVKDKINSNNFYDILSTVENGMRKYQQVN